MQFPFLKPGVFIPTIIAFGVLGDFGLRRADASFLEGKQVLFEAAWPSQTTVQFAFGPLTVGPGPELTPPVVAPLVGFTADISDTSIQVMYPNAALFATDSFNGYILQEDSPGLPSFTYAAVDPSTTLKGFDNSRVSFDATHVYLNVEGLSVQPGQQFVVDLAPVPEPASLGILALGGTLTLRRRRRMA